MSKISDQNEQETRYFILAISFHPIGYSISTKFFIVNYSFFNILRLMPPVTSSNEVRNLSKMADSSCLSQNISRTKLDMKKL